MEIIRILSLLKLVIIWEIKFLLKSQYILCKCIPIKVKNKLIGTLYPIKMKLFFLLALFTVLLAKPVPFKECHT